MIKVITSYQTLMQKAGALGKARKSGNQEAIRIAEQEHNEYRKLCLQSDEMSLDMTIGELSNIMRGV